MLLIFYALTLAALMDQDDASIASVCSINKAVNSGRYELETSYTGRVSNSHNPEAFAHLPPEIRNKLSTWQLTLTNLNIPLDRSSKVLFQSKDGVVAAKSKAILVDELPSDEEIMQLKTFDEFRSWLGPPQEKGFRDGSVRIDSDGKSITSTTEQWVVCSLGKEEAIQYLRVVLCTKERAGKVSVVDRWVQRADLRKDNRSKGSASLID